ncbi:uncharacterized protein cubi_02813 [Cryptosporidium ubiquitum]|uniref:Uncharacterized protein n=1 Tax=Cryptosporidium ubiquitum TaxID=857276 RepID=A0A1J4MKP2_9CRYT|nr:uncharacterized protein cubi_02813 [Cryptosporidium ubiquitum]OII74011.1 hypothetical protein cubi_02813 [Cryptosporidium ubiquitum]
MSHSRTLKILGLLLLGICLNVEVKSQKVSTTIESDLSLNSTISKNGTTAPIEPVESSNATMNSSSITNSSNVDFGKKLINPEIIPVNTNYTQDSCFNRTLPINCNNSNSTLLVPITSRFTTTIIGDSNNLGIKYEFKSEDDVELISFRLNSNDKNAAVKVSSLVNGTQVNGGLTSLELKGNQDDFTINNNVTNSTSNVGKITFVMVLTNTTISFTVNNLVYNILNINLAEKPIRISKIQTSGLENVKISVIPFIKNDEMERCVLKIPITGNDANLNISPYSNTCLSSNVIISESSLVAGSQIVLGIPGIVSSKSVKVPSKTHIILSSKSGLVIFHLLVNDKGLFLKGVAGTDIVQSKGGYFPFQSYGFQSYTIKLIFTSLFVTISVNGFYAFDPIVIPNGEIPHGILFEGLHRNPTSTLLPTRTCTKYSYSGTGSCFIDGILPVLKSPGTNQTNESHGQTLVAVRVVSDSNERKKKTFISFNNNADVSEFLVEVDGKKAALITNLTNLDKVDYENISQNDTFLLKDENIGGLRRNYFNNLENTKSTRVSNTLKDYSVNVNGNDVSQISSEFKPIKKSCVLEQHRGSYISTVCEGNKLCFASGSTGSPVGGTLHFIGGFLNGILKVKIYTKMDDFSFEIEYTSSGNISVYRTTAIKENEPIYKGNYLNSSTSTFERGIISIKDLGQFMLLSIDKIEVTKISKGGYGPDGNISCVQFFANESDDISIFFEIQ